jgi:hypothetical protein
MTVKLPTVGATTPLAHAPVHVIVQNPDNTYALVNSDTGRSHINCADLPSAIKEKARLDALAVQEKF